MPDNDNKIRTQSLLSGAMLLMITTALVHVINIFFKIPITNIIGEVGRGYFTSAYEIYTPIYAISMAGLPASLSKMVSERMALGQYREVKKVRDVAKIIFITAGILGTLLICALAYPFSHYIIGSPNTFYSILCIGPSIFFCCLMSTYRGYYAGMRNMAPTGFSQLIECIGKLIFGTILAKLVMVYANNKFEAGEKVFGTVCTTKAEVIRAAAPLSSAAAISGVTLGTIVALIFLFFLYHTKGTGITHEMYESSPEPDDAKSLRKKLINLVIPIATGSLVLNITNLIDTSTVQSRLKYAVSIGETTIRDMYPAIQSLGISTEDIKDFLYGCYGIGLDFRNLVPSIIMTLGVSAIPVLSGAYATKDKEKIADAVNTVVKTAAVLAVPAGLVMAALAKPALRILYPSSQSIDISAPFIVIYGIAALLLAISTPINSMLQAIGRPDIPVKTLLVSAVVKIFLNYALVGNPVINVMGAPIGTVAFYLINVANNLMWLLRLTDVRLNVYKTIIKPCIAGIIAGAAAMLSNYIILYKIFDCSEKLTFTPALTSCIISILFAIFIWTISLGVFKVLSKNGVLSLPKGEKIAKVLAKMKVLG